MRRLAASFLRKHEFMRIGVGAVFSIAALQPPRFHLFVIVAAEQHHLRHTVRSDEGIEVTALDALGILYCLSLYSVPDDGDDESTYKIMVRFGAPGDENATSDR